jgi:type IV pilus assembly protein PilB
LVMGMAVQAEAGDIHVDPVENGVRIRFRIDGILHDIAEIGKEHYIPLMSKIKDLAGLEQSVKKATYDGRFTVMFESEPKIDCRLSIISGAYGETAVIRILAKQAAALRMEELGIRNQTLPMLLASVKKTKGIIITTGPTGSGKTTTLYSMLNSINNPDVKIITIEDPIEYHLEGVMQTQVDPEQGYTFASALRSLMRQNPNIIMIGEIRDNETAKVAVEAAQTGHLVLSTVHANSAAGAISRLAGLGIDRQELASSIECLIGQRLVRQICPACRQEQILDEATMAEVKTILNQIDPRSGVVLPAEWKFYHGTGCPACKGIGYKGRLGIYELIVATPDIQKTIQLPGVTDFDIEQAAMSNGTVLMLQDGLLKALAGETSVEEVFRVAK